MKLKESFEQSSFKRLSLAERRDRVKSEVSQRLLSIMEKKKTCLCLAIDFTDPEKILAIARKAAKFVCAVKLHADIIEKFSKQFASELTELANQFDVLIFEDRKFAEVEAVVELQAVAGHLDISSWADVATIHAVAGQPMVDVFKDVVKREETKLKGCLLVAELSTKGALTNTKDYRKDSLQLASENADIVSGIMCRNRNCGDDSFLYWTRDHQLGLANGCERSQGRSIEDAVLKGGNDILVIEVQHSVDDLDTWIEKCRELAWKALVDSSTLKDGSCFMRTKLEKRKELVKNKFNERLIDVMLQKKTCLCVALGSADPPKMMEIAKTVSPYVCAILINSDAMDAFDKQIALQLAELSSTENVVILEDRKFADTGSTVVLQATAGHCEISSWANLVTVHPLPGQPIFDAFRKIIEREKSRLESCLMVAELGTDTTLTDSKDYRKDALNLARNNPKVVCGIICQKRDFSDDSLLYWTPGVNLDAQTDGCGQQWRSIEQAIIADGNDVVIVGRALTCSSNFEADIVRYQEESWRALMGAMEVRN